MLNKDGPRIEPRGTAIVSSRVFESVTLKCVISSTLLLSKQGSELTF